MYLKRDIRIHFRLLVFTLTICFTGPLITGCVIKTSAQNQTNKNETASHTPEIEKSQRLALEDELKKLKAQLKTYKADLKALNQKVVGRSKTLQKELISLEEARAFVKKMGDQLEKNFKKTLAPLREGSKDALEKSNQEIKAFQKSLKERKRKLSKLKQDVTNKINSIFSAGKEDEANN
ncbi:MAG: DUF3450 domain-containing protein [Nitrospirae bacterium]|nr:DUF3450 domain-containing protein [Candidatus Manganitrophaceae bacterium]